MKNHYLIQSRRWWLTMSWIISATVSLWAQTTQPPLIQWQRVTEGGGVNAASPIRAVEAANGGYAVLAGKNLVRLLATGDLLWSQPVPGTYQDSAAGYTSVAETVALTTSSDSGFVVLARDVLKQYYVVKVNASGNSVWVKTIDDANAGPEVVITDNAIAPTPDGGFLVVGVYTGGLSYLTMTKLTGEGAISSQWRVRYPDPSQTATPVIRKILTGADGSFLLIGRAAASDSRGLAIKLDKKYNMTWQQTYSAVDSLTDGLAGTGDEAGSAIAVGRGRGGNGQAIRIAPNSTDDGKVVATFPGIQAPVSLASDGMGNLTVLDGAPSAKGDFRLTSVTLQSSIRWTRSFGGSGSEVPTALLATQDGGYLAVGTTTSGDGDVVGKSAGTVAAWMVKLGSSPLATTLSLQAPTYNCSTGAIVFNTTGGDGSSIVYTAPGVTRASVTDNFGTVEQELRQDPKVITIQATQSSQTVSYTFDFGAYCRFRQPEPDSLAPNALKLIAPTYNCQTGAITFHAVGGDGSPIEYAAPGITTWSTNPNQYVDRETRTAYDAQPLTLMARQNGAVVMYVFDVKAVCGRAFYAGSDPAAALNVAVLGNPVQEAVTVALTGATGQSVEMHLLDNQGRLIEKRAIGQAGVSETQTFNLRQQAPGVLLLHTTINGQTQTVQVLKQ